MTNTPPLPNPNKLRNQANAKLENFKFNNYLAKSVPIGSSIKIDQSILKLKNIRTDVLGRQLRTLHNSGEIIICQLNPLNQQLVTINPALINSPSDVIKLIMNGGFTIYNKSLKEKTEPVEVGGPEAIITFQNPIPKPDVDEVRTTTPTNIDALNAVLDNLRNQARILPRPAPNSAGINGPRI